MPDQKGGNMNQKTKTNKTGFTAHLFAVKLLEKVVEFFKKLLSAKLLNFCIKWLTLIGHIGIIVAAAIGFLFTVIFAFKINQLDLFLTAFVWVILLFVIQYTAHKFSSSGEELIKNNPSQLASKNFLDCLGFLILLLGVFIFVTSIILLIRGATLVDFLEGVGTFVFLEFVALVAFNFKEVNVKHVEENSAGQEAIGILTFFIKTGMKLVPIIFGAFVAIGTIMLFIEGLRIFGSGAGFAFRNIQKDIAPLILGAALIPFLSYVFFAFAYLVIDIIRAILSIPENK